MKLSGLAGLSVIALGLIAGSGTALAKDCGMPPAEAPSIPDGATATSDEISQATRAVQDYALKVQTYLNCLELNKEAFFLNMSEAQRARWAEDYNALADKLTEIETALNEQIQIYNARQ